MPTVSRFLTVLFLLWIAGGAVAPSAVHAASEPEIIQVVKTGDHDALRRLIADGAPVDAAHGDGATALHWAAYRADRLATALLIEAGASVDVANDLGATPLWLAASGQDADIVRQLLQAGADPRRTLKRGETPLMAAARAGQAQAVRQLLAHGADVDAREHERGQTALMWAAAQRHADVVRLLTAHGADVQATSRVWRQLENTAGNTNGSGNFEMRHGGSSALLFVARNGDVETARALIEAGADINDTAASGTSALVVAAHSGHADLARFLLDEGADPDAADGGYTALHAAVLRSEVELVEALLEHGADADAVVRRGTPGRRFSADYSLRHQAVGANALWLAAKYGELEILRRLAEHGASPWITPYSGESVLQAAMGVPRISQENRRNRVGAPLRDPSDEEEETLDMIRLLLDLGVDIDATNDRGDTAIHDAVRRGFTTIVGYLAERGANLDATNARGQTPLTLAETPQPVYGTNGLRTTRPEIAALLRELGATG